MKIAMIGQKGIPANSGGVEKHVEELATRFVNDGHDVTVYCRNTYVEDSNLKEYKGVKLKTIKTIKNKSLDAIVYTLKSTLHALFRERYDIYHYHALGPASLSFIPRLFGKKVIVTVHGLDWQREKWGKFAKLYLKFGEQIAGRYANKIISVSDNLRDYFIDKYNRNEDDVIFIPNGVNISEPLEPNIIKSKYGLDKDEYILFLARLVPEKGAHYLIEAYKKLDTNKKLIIAGGASFTDDYAERLHNMSKDSKNIIFTGNVIGDEVKELYSNCYIYVLPSDIEGMPLTLLEAMSFGKLCLVSDIPENKNVVKDNKYGFTFLRGNIMDLKNKIDTLSAKTYNTPEYKKKVNSYININYNWGNVATDTYKIYTNILEHVMRENA